MLREGLRPLFLFASQGGENHVKADRRKARRFFNSRKLAMECARARCNSSRPLGRGDEFLLEFRPSVVHPDRGLAMEEVWRLTLIVPGNLWYTPGVPLVIWSTKSAWVKGLLV